MLRLRLLGDPKIDRSGEPIEGFRSRKIEALLYYLASTEGSQQRTKLATLFWSESTEKQANRNLRYALWNLRQVLTDLSIESDRVHVDMHKADQLRIDVDEFVAVAALLEKQGGSSIDDALATRLQHAVSLYRGEFLTGFELEDAPQFNDWIENQRFHLNKKLSNILSHLATYFKGQGQLNEAVAATRQLIELDPWQEGVQRQLMALLVLTGKRDAAVQHFQSFAKLLKEELNLTPEAETVALVERIRKGGALPAEEHAFVEQPSDPIAAIPFVGHQKAYGELIDQWEKGVREKSGLLLIRGETGIGKTRLVEELSRYVTLRGGLVLAGRCYEFSGSLPYQPIAMAIESQIENIRVRHLPSNQLWLHELGQLIPELRSETQSIPPQSFARQETDRYRLFEAVARLLEAMTSDQPLLLSVDDLHWADADTLDLLGYLVRRLSACPIVIIGTYRPGEVATDHALVALRRPLYNTGLDREIGLQELSFDAVERLVEALGTGIEHANLSHFLYDISHGNPFVLVETLDEMREYGWIQPSADHSFNLSLPQNCLIDETITSNPELHALCHESAACRQPILFDRLLTAHSDRSVPMELSKPNRLRLGEVKDRIARRIARLSAESRQLLSIAALSGHAFDAKLLMAASGMGMLQVLDCLEDWIARNLVKEVAFHDPRPARFGQNSFLYDFSHDLIRSVAYHGLSPLRKQVFHRQLGLALEELHSGRIETVIERLANHFHQANEVTRALHYLQRAGQQARAVYALPIALERFQLALSYWEQVYDVADANISTAAWRQRWELLYSLSEVTRMLGQQSTQDLISTSVVDEVTSWGDERDRLRMIEEQLAQLKNSADLKKRRELAREGLKSAQMLRDALAEANFLQAAADCDRDMGNHEEAQHNYDQASNIFLSLDDQTQQIALCLIGLGKIHKLNNRYGQALACFERAATYARDEGSQDVLVRSFNAVAELYLYSGNLEGAMAVSRNAIDLCDKLGFNEGAISGLITQGVIYLLNEDLAAARKQLERAWEIALQTGQSLRMADAQCSLGHLRMAEQEYRHALVHFEQTEAYSGNFYSGRAIEARSFRAIAHLRLGEMDEALVASHHAVVWLIGREHLMNAPQRVYWNQHEVMLAHWEAVEAQEALVQAHRMMRDQLEAIAEAYPASVSDSQIRDQFVTRLTWNQDIAMIWEMLPLTNSHSALHYAG